MSLVGIGIALIVLGGFLQAPPQSKKSGKRPYRPHYHRPHRRWR